MGVLGLEPSGQLFGLSSIWLSTLIKIRRTTSTAASQKLKLVNRTNGCRDIHKNVWQIFPNKWPELVAEKCQKICGVFLSKLAICLSKCWAPTRQIPADMVQTFTHHSPRLLPLANIVGLTVRTFTPQSQKYKCHVYWAHKGPVIIMTMTSTVTRCHLEVTRQTLDGHSMDTRQSPDDHLTLYGIGGLDLL